jgi:hypothetical protein
MVKQLNFFFFSKTWPMPTAKPAYANNFIYADGNRPAPMMIYADSPTPTSF